MGHVVMRVGREGTGTAIRKRMGPRASRSAALYSAFCSARKSARKLCIILNGSVLSGETSTSQ
jgi:hypothetical protein